MRDCRQAAAEGAEEGATQRDAVTNRFVHFPVSCKRAVPTSVSPSIVVHLTGSLWPVGFHVRLISIYICFWQSEACCQHLIYAATLQWQLDNHFGSNSGRGPKKAISEGELDSSRAETIVGPEDYNVIQTNGMDGANLAVTCVTSTAPTTTALPPTTTTSTITSTSVSSESAGADFAGWVDCIDWPDLEGSLGMPLDVTETTLLDQLDRADAGPYMMATRLKLTDLMRADLCDNPVHPIPMVAVIYSDPD